MLDTLRGRLIAGYITVALAALLITTAAYLAQEIQIRRKDSYDQLQTTLYLLAPQINRAMLRPNQRQDILEGADDLLAALGNTDYRLLLVRRDGRINFDNGTKDNWAGRFLTLPAKFIDNPDPDMPISGTVRLDGREQDWLYAAAPPRTLQHLLTPKLPQAGGRPPTYVVLVVPTPDRDVWSNFLRRFLVFAAGAGLIAVVLGALLARTLARPLAALSRATHAIAAGDYSAQAPAGGTAETRTLASDFNHMAEAVRRAQQAQRDLLANVSHDLKTPLTSIQGFSQAMLDGTVTDTAGYRSAAGVIHDESRRMARLVGDILDLARLEGGATVLQRAPTDLPGLLTQVANGLLPQAAERGVQLQVETVPAPAVPVDSHQMHRALGNLLDNALRHTPAGGRVTLGMEPANGVVRIHVRDTGDGIPAAALPHIFDRFYQADPARTANGHGAGLGLAIAHEIVAAHGGTLTAESAPGAGSDFIVSLPVDGRQGRGL
jgi:signal transduction histidine kinase